MFTNIKLAITKLEMFSSWGQHHQGQQGAHGMSPAAYHSMQADTCLQARCKKKNGLSSSAWKFVCAALMRKLSTLRQ
jgi:hypothetical protein